ncbi:MAG: Crp/Fnr family transcriptional regulator [Acidiferrobacterales bacterium]
MPVDLSNVPLFESLSDDERQAIAAMATTRSLPTNSIVVNEGDQTDSMYIILSGKVKIFLSDEDGKEITLGIEGPGDYFGEMVLDGGRRSASVMTIEQSKFSIIQKHDLEKYLQQNPDVALAIVRHLISRIRTLSENVRSLALLDVYGRLRKLLLELAIDEHGRKVIKEKITQQELANRVGASREMVSKILKELTIGGYIQIDKKIITILKDPPKGW